MKAKIYYGICPEENERIMYTTVTGQMGDGTFVYTEVASKGGAIITENGEPKLILDNQYTRRIGDGWQTFHRI